MAQIRYRANLAAKDFVFSSQNWGRSVILKQYDQNFSRQIVSPTDPDKDIGIPQIYYGHNIMPAAQGFQSVGYIQEVGAAVSSGLGFQIVPYSDIGSGNSGVLFFVQSGTSYLVYGLAEGATVWTFVGTIAGVTFLFPTWRITWANVNGQTYFLVPGTNCFTYNGITLTTVTLTGLTISQIIGITASFGYMIAWSTSSIAWSSTLTPTDFTPSLITGAGGGSITELKGNITVCAHHTFGFIVFSPYNCVAAVYSGNSRYPFNFREIIGGGGVDVGGQLIDLDSESGNLYAWTSAGLQIVSVTQAQAVFPEVTNFIGGSRFEDFNDATLAFVETDITTGFLNKQLNIIADRYLVISYGLSNTDTNYTHALIYDTSMKRWGKLKFTHVDVFEYALYPTADRARFSMAFVDPNGIVSLLDFSYLATTGGTIILGKYQHARDRLITLDQVDLEYVQNTANLKVNLLPTFDGKTFLAPVPLTALAATNAPQYPCRTTGMNISVLLQGIFQLDSLMLTYHANGRR